MKKEINNEFEIKILDNKINNKFWKECGNKKESVLENLTIEKIANMINNRFDKIKIVKDAKYLGLIVYEYKIVVDKNLEVRMGYSVDYQNKIVCILGLCHLTSGLRKNVFDSLIRNLYGK